MHLKTVWVDEGALLLLISGGVAARCATMTEPIFEPEMRQQNRRQLGESGSKHRSHPRGEGYEMTKIRENK